MKYAQSIDLNKYQVQKYKAPRNFKLLLIVLAIANLGIAVFIINTYAGLGYFVATGLGLSVWAYRTYVKPILDIDFDFDLSNEDVQQIMEELYE